MRAKVIPTPTISRIIQYKTLRSVIFVILIYNSIFLYEVILHYKRKKAKEKQTKQFVISAHPGIDPSPLVPTCTKILTKIHPNYRWITGETDMEFQFSSWN